MKNAAATDPFLVPRMRPALERAEFNPEIESHRQAIVKYVETGNWDTRIDIYGSHNVPYDALKKMSLYACKYNRIK